jgi:hypothetical protein
MMARLILALACASLLVATGCCCTQTCGDPCGGPGCNTCCFSWPRPIVWNGACNDCGPGPCEACSDCPQTCGILPWFYRSRICGKGCGEIYMGEWISDPPDCCDPCDPCHGCFTGQQGCCNLGPFQRILAAMHGYSYCPPPDCGPVCGLCSKGCCTAGHVGYEMHGQFDAGMPSPGCATCGGGHGHAHPHGANLYYKGPIDPHHALDPQRGVDPHIMHENWNIPRTKPIPGKPIHNAQQPMPGQMTKAKKPVPARPGYQQSVRKSPPIGSGVRPAGYQR